VRLRSVVVYVFHLALHYEYLLYVACGAPRYQPCHVTIPLLYGAMYAGGCRAVVYLVFLVEGCAQMLVRVLPLGGEQYGRVKATA
jgi:hypothetical protein